ncbi:acetyl-CoA hydrolase/transferase family protein [Micropruina sonneratiae]|uniref:acetyl-CoA hydrolase/transferase family protein n=1 Tax=Micropruina sonneratiae TaxID=2986940 RepID=UPI002226528C|nr:acetyl-CoA hydrolase/transferase family protein [Micropruina sp. KQZ13P-5]MCW3158770.1 acetyl-CoA hydrolase/transferase family protein [Micropruina sp. KQZ13P-5]
MSRVQNEQLRKKITTAEEAAKLIKPGTNVGMSGFTGAGYPKEVPTALAAQIKAAHERGEEFQIGLFTGASTAPELDGVLAEVDGISFRTPYQSDPMMRRKINEGISEYADIHLSHLAPMIWAGSMGALDTAVVEVTAVKQDGSLVPSSSVGNNKTFLDRAQQIILEVNSWQSADLEGMHDIYYGTRLPPERQPVMLTHTGDRIGQRNYSIDLDKVVAVIETDDPDRNTPFKPADADSEMMAGYFLEFLTHEVKHGRLPKDLLPLQSGVGNVANAVLSGLASGPFEYLTSYTEVIQDGMVDLIDSGKMTVASATAFSLSPEYAQRMNDEAKHYRDKIVLRPQEISNHPEMIRRLGVIACNGMIEADIYGNVNSTHIMGSRMQNGIGGSADFTRNSFIAAFVTPSVAKGGAISCIVPMVSHHDHTEHDVQVLITEQGLADLRGLSPKQRARKIISTCAHPAYRPMLQEYFDHAQQVANGQQTPHDLRLALSWHQRFLETGTMQPA